MHPRDDINSVDHHGRETLHPSVVLPSFTGGSLSGESALQAVSTLTESLSSRRSVMTTLASDSKPFARFIGMKRSEPQNIEQGISNGEVVSVECTLSFLRSSAVPCWIFRGSSSEGQEFRERVPFSLAWH